MSGEQPLALTSQNPTPQGLAAFQNIDPEVYNRTIELTQAFSDVELQAAEKNLELARKLREIRSLLSPIKQQGKKGNLYDVWVASFAYSAEWARRLIDMANVADELGITQLDEHQRLRYIREVGRLMLGVEDRQKLFALTAGENGLKTGDLREIVSQVNQGEATLDQAVQGVQDKRANGVQREPASLRESRAISRAVKRVMKELGDKPEALAARLRKITPKDVAQPVREALSELAELCENALDFSSERQDRKRR